MTDFGLEIGSDDFNERDPYLDPYDTDRLLREEIDRVENEKRMT